MDICKQMEVLGGNGEVRIPRFIGVVHEELSSRVIGLLLSWVDCENKTLECSLGPEIPSTLRMKWDRQVTITVACLHKAHIIWGNAKPANILIDTNGDTWIIGFGSGYTRGWVEKDHMETIQGDAEGISKIREFLCPESHFEEDDLNGEEVMGRR